MQAICKNYRANENSIQLKGACFAHSGQVLADLYTPEGEFIRTAVVADCNSRERARKYAKMQNDYLTKP